MQDFTIALVQHASPLRKKEQNFRATIAWTRKAAKAGADLVLFPELNITGHGGHRSMIEQAEQAPGGACCRALADVAAELGVYVCAGLAELDRGAQYNCQFIVGPDGFVGKQRKTHLSRDEYFYFRHGSELPVFDLPFARVGIVICFDNVLPEIPRALAVKGAEVILSPHAARSGRWPRTPAERREVIGSGNAHWQMLYPGRAYDNACYVCLTNTVGRSAQGIRGVKADHLGGMMVWGPNGAMIAKNDPARMKEEMLVVPLKAAPLHARRNAACLPLRVRRPEVFKALTEPTA